MTDHENSRPLTSGARLLLSRILTADVPGGAQLRDQIPLIEVVGGPLTLLELAPVAPVAPAPVADVPLPVSVTVLQTGVPVGELLVWVTNGVLSGLEFAWWTDDPPDALPEVEDLRDE